MRVNVSHFNDAAQKLISESEKCFSGEWTLHQKSQCQKPKVDKKSGVDHFVKSLLFLQLLKSKTTNGIFSLLEKCDFSYNHFIEFTYGDFNLIQQGKNAIGSFWFLSCFRQWFLTKWLNGIFDPVSFDEVTPLSFLQWLSKWVPGCYVLFHLAENLFSIFFCETSNSFSKLFTHVTAQNQCVKLFWMIKNNFKGRNMLHVCPIM